MPETTVNITPAPRILNVLAHTTMSPIDALCELIDNAIDAFGSAEEQGISIENPTITIEIPSARDIARRQGRIRVADNGPGMTISQVQNALRAGYSSNNSYDNLGLFGVGFNISTSKFGVRTRVATLRPGNNRYLCVTVDLQELNRNRNFEVPYEEIEWSALNEFFPRRGMSGTIVEITHWWPEGDTNHAFALNLARQSDASLMRTLGRRYSSILKERHVRLVLNGHECKPFHHCVWQSDRFVIRRGEQVPAVMQIDDVVGVVRKCEACGAEVPEVDRECPECNCREIRNIEQRVQGWIGIQRYEDKAKYGIDLIRNGRCICESEKAAFFFSRNEDGELEKEYPQDNGGTNGRIIGEIHIDFVPVGFTKEDFDRSSVEWHKAIKCIRGETSLLPSRIPEGQENNSCLFRLFQAYRRSDPGPTCLYMGVWDVTKNGPSRISKDVIEDYKNRFERNEPGYGWEDDSEWYKHVEAAVVPPIPEVSHCPNPQCQLELPEGAEECPACGTIINGKRCVNSGCNKEIPRSARTCPHCNADQLMGTDGTVPQGGSNPSRVMDVVWFCQVCHARNVITEESCCRCHQPKGALDPLGETFLRENSDKKDNFSKRNLAFDLPDGTRTGKISFDVYFVRNKIQPYSEEGTPLKTLPFVEFRSANSLVLFVDPVHSFFSRGELSIKEMVAQEVAQHVLEYSLQDAAQSFSVRLSILVGIVKHACWHDDFDLDKKEVTVRIEEIFKVIKEQLVEASTSEDEYFSELNADDKIETLRALAANHVSEGRYSEVCTNGEFLRYAPDRFAVQLFDQYPEDFFEKGVFKPSVPEDTVRLFGQEAARELHMLNVRQIGGYMETLLTFASMDHHACPDNEYLELVRLTANALMKKMAVNV